MTCVPERLNLWEQVLVKMMNDNTLSLDKFQVHKIMPAIKELMTKSHCMTAGDFIQYFRSIEPELQKVFWAYDYMIPEKFAKPIKFDYLCWYMKHSFYKTVIREIFRSSNQDVNDMILILMITDSCLSFDPGFFETIIHKFSMFMLQEVLFMFCPNVIPNRLTTKINSKKDKNYHEKMAEISNRNTINIEDVKEFFCLMHIEIDQDEFNKKPPYLEYLKPSGYDYMMRHITSVSDYCQVLQALYHQPGFSYDEIAKMVLITVEQTVSHGDIDPQILQAFAEFICLQMME